jgi:hypothetical protein
MQSVIKEMELVPAHVLMITLVILMKAADLNVCLVQTVLQIELVLEINVRIHALGFVAKMQNVQLLIIFLCATVSKVTLGIHFSYAQCHHFNVGLLLLNLPLYLIMNNLIII